MTAIQLERARHMWALSDHDVGARIDGVVREGHHVASVLAVEDGVAADDMFKVLAFAPAMERHDDDRVRSLKRAHKRRFCIEVVDVERAGIGREGYDGGTPAAFERDLSHARVVAVEAEKSDMVCAQRGDGRGAAGFAVIAAMIVGEADGAHTQLREQCCIGCGLRKA